MEFGVFILAQQRGYHQTSQQVINNAVEQTVIAEAAGFDTAWYAEHHFNNYSLCPSPLMMVAHCAPITKQIRLGTAVVVLPLYNPARLAAEIATADALSNGRLTPCPQSRSRPIAVPDCTAAERTRRSRGGSSW